jgi:hypothetical protein
VDPLSFFSLQAVTVYLSGQRILAFTAFFLSGSSKRELYSKA